MMLGSTSGPTPEEPPEPPSGRPPGEPPQAAPRPWEGMVLVGCCALLFTVGAPFSRLWGMPGRFLVFPAVAFLLPSLVWAWSRGVLRSSFPPARLEGRSVALSAALIIGGSMAALGLAGLFSQFSSSGPEEEAVRSMLLSVGPGWRYVYFALAPALFEESLFRGALLRSVSSWESGPAALVSAITFAAIHASVPKFLPVALLGWVLAQAVIRTGNFWVAVAGHALHNGGVLWAMELGAPGTEAASPVLLLCATLAGLLMVWATLRVGFRRGGPTETGS